MLQIKLRRPKRRRWLLLQPFFLPKKGSTSLVNYAEEGEKKEWEDEDIVVLSNEDVSG
jgi:hypothetical protein